ncbi:hypothetical protein ES705_21003 [subsurface metagenome]
MRRKTKKITENSTAYIIPQKSSLPPMHRQSRSLFKTSASVVGRDREQTLFTLPAYQGNVNPFKKVMSKNTAIMGNLLIKLWQKNKDEKGIYTIKNLTEIARLMKTRPQELKVYLLCLAGYQYPVTKINKETRTLSIYSDKLFYIKFNMRFKKGEDEDSFNNDYRTGTDYISFIRDRFVKSVEITPSASIIEGLEGKGLGNVLVDDNFVAFSLGLSDLAYKLFCFSGSNRPTFKIGFRKLTSKKYLNLGKQIYGVYDDKGKRIRAGQGKRRILENIKRAFTELLVKGHLKEWGYNEIKDQFNWVYSDKFIKHKELLSKKDIQAK